MTTVGPVNAVADVNGACIFTVHTLARSSHFAGRHRGVGERRCGIESLHGVWGILLFAMEAVGHYWIGCAVAAVTVKRCGRC